MSTNHHKLAIFDIDGTIASSGTIPAEIIAGFKHLQSIGYTTTISTGRGYVRAKEVFGSDFESLISPDALLVVEHGTKIVDRDGTVAFTEEFSASEIDHIIDFIRENIEIIQLVWFNPIDVTDKVKVWCSDEGDVEEQRAKRSHYGDVFTSSIGELREQLLQHKLSNITARLKSHVQVHNLKLALAHVPLHLIFQDGNLEFLKNNINKAISIMYLLREYSLTPADLLVAGNAINDVEMLDIDAAHRFLVGDEASRAAVMAYLSEGESVVAAESPAHLGQLLTQMPRN